jgi:hypothetical protein
MRCVRQIALAEFAMREADGAEEWGRRAEWRRKRTFFKKTTRMEDFGHFLRFSTTRMGTRMDGKTTRMAWPVA